MSRQFTSQPHATRRSRTGITSGATFEPLERRALLSGTPLGGPDGFGYSAFTHPYEPIDLQFIPGVDNGVAPIGGPTAPVQNADDAAEPFSLGSNTFNFYGTHYSTLFANTNGVATSEFNPGLFVNNELTTGGAMIAPLWDDWRTDISGEVLRRFDDFNGDGMAERLVLEWSDVRGFVTLTTGSPESVTFQLILQLNTGNEPGNIIFNYLDTLSGDVRDNGGSATVGIKADGPQGPNRLLVSKDVARPYLASGTAIIISKNRPPTLDPVGSYEVAEGGTVTLTANAVDPDGDELLYEWDVNGDGTFETAGAAVEFTGVDGPASLSVPVRVSDGRGQVVTGAAAVTVNNVAPSLVLSGADAAPEGSDYALSLGDVTDPGQDTVTSYVVHWGDGASETVFAADLPPDRTLHHTYADGAVTADVSVDVVDEDGPHLAAGTKTVSVVNVAPTVALSGPASVNEGGTFALVLAPTADPGTDTVTAFIINWGDGTADTIAVADLPADRTLHHVFADDGARTVTADVVDEDGTHAAGSIATTVENVAPAFSNVHVTPALNEGGTAVLTATVTDPGALDSHTVTIDWGDGTPLQTVAVNPDTKTVDATHTYADDRPQGSPDVYDVALTVSDDDGGSTSAGAAVAVANVAPTASFTAITNTGAGYVVAAGVPVGFHGTATDPGADTLTAVWEISDDNFARVLHSATGTVNADGTVSGSFTFSQPGVYKVRLLVTDGDGGTATADRIGDAEATVVVYDSTAGYVIGGGWFNSPAGSYAPNPSLTGTAHFAFVSKYQAGSSTPIGTTQFLFKAAGLHFSSFSYEFMVVAGHKAQFRGTGTLNGKTGYRFKLTAIDGQRTGGGGQDKFRIQIWNSSNTLVYDNQRFYDIATGTWISPDEDGDPTTLVLSGSIIIRS